MEIYIDKDNLLSYIRSAKSDAFIDCQRWFKKNADIYFRFSKEDIRTDSDIMEWIKTLTEGYETISPKWESKFPLTPLKSNTHKSFNKRQLSAMYFISDENINKREEEGNILYVPKGKEIDYIFSLIFEDYQYTICKDPRKFKSWDDINISPTPCSDIIVADRYIFSNIELLKSNLYKILKHLCSKVKRSIVNIVIFTKGDKDCCYKDIISEIKKLIKDTIGQEPKVTIVPSAMKQEHDRTIFSNYMSYNSGDSFNYFDSSNNIITKGRNVYIKSNASKENLNSSLQFVENMQQIVKSLIEGNNAESIIGDKKCNYIRFELQKD